MRQEVFHFKQFDIAQDRCAMKVGTDGVLLGTIPFLPGEAGSVSFAEKDSWRILDIGTGTGLIALMIAQRLSDAGYTDFHIDAIEIDSEAADQARKNIAATPWSRQIQVHHSPLQEFQTESRYDLIISNPPFYNATLKPEDDARAIARHKDSLPLKEIMSFTRSHLEDNGELALIYPMDYDSEVMTEAVLAEMKPIWICNILTKTGKTCKRRMLKVGHLKNNLSNVNSSELLTQLCLRNELGDYSEEYRKLTEPFYVSLK